MHTLREHSLEEGNVPTAKTVAVALLDYVREYAAVRTYFAAWLWLAVLLMMRPPLAPLETPLRSPAEYADLYAHMRSADVLVGGDVAVVVRDMRRAMLAFNVSFCLAAIHIGVPLRVGIVGPENADDEHTVLVNPVLVQDSGLDKMSTAKEDSPFWPDKPPMMMRRAFPVTVRDRDAFHLFTDRAQAHCVHHLLDAFDGRQIYDRR